MLILNLLSLMRDANIPDMSLHSHPDEVLRRVEDRFRLDLTGIYTADVLYLHAISVDEMRIKCIMKSMRYFVMLVL